MLTTVRKLLKIAQNGKQHINKDFSLA